MSWACRSLPNCRKFFIRNYVIVNCVIIHRSDLTMKQCFRIISCVNRIAANGKSSWSELVGKKGSEAMAVILRERPDITRAILVPQAAVLTDAYCGDCGDASVTAVPMIG